MSIVLANAFDSANLVWKDVLLNYVDMAPDVSKELFKLRLYGFLICELSNGLAAKNEKKLRILIAVSALISLIAQLFILENTVMF